MTKKILTLAVLTSAMAFTLAACEHGPGSPLNMAPGKYERTTRSTDSYGTETERRSSTEVEYDEYGNKKAVVKTKTTKDPKGLFNKKTTSKTKVIQEEDR